MRKSSLLYFIIIFLLVNETANGSSKNQESTFTVKTKSGTFPLSIPILRLPKLQKYPLVQVIEDTLPELPNWYDPRYIPENPSWLDQAGKFYKEGIEYMYRGEMNLSLKRFRAVTENYPETLWYSLSFFWKGQINAQQKNFEKAVKSLTFFIDTYKSNNNSEIYSDYLNFSRYTLVWIAVKRKNYKKALNLVDSFDSKITIKKIREQLLYVKFFIYKKLKQSDSIFVLLENATNEFPFGFINIVRLAEFYFDEKRWQELIDLVGQKVNEKMFYNEPTMEYFLWLGVVAEMNLKNWARARTKMKSLEELGVRNFDNLLLGLLRINLEEKKFGLAWEKWLKINDDVLREQSLRELVHFAIKGNNFNFLLKKLPNLKNLAKYWRPWQAEMELIYAYIYLKLGQKIKARQWLNWALNHSFQNKGEKSLVIVHEESLFIKTVIELISVENKKAFLNLKRLLEDYSSSPRLSDYYFWYGVLLYEIEEKPLEAIMAIRQVEHEGERDDDRWYLLGKINHDQQKWRPAIYSFKSLEKKHPESIFLEEGLYLKAHAYYEQKLYNLALETLNDLSSKFLEQKKPIREIHLRVRILLAMKKFEMADEVLRRRIAFQSDLSLIKLRVEVLKNIKDPRRILNVTGLGLGISTSEDQGFLYFHRANALFDTKKYKEADAYYNLALKKPPKGSERFIKYRMLKIQYELGRIPELINSLKVFLKVRKDDNFSNEILLLVGDYFLNRDQKEKASPYLKQILANYKKSVRQVDLAPEKRMEQIFLIGKLYNGLNEFKMAERWLNQALKSIETLEQDQKTWQLTILREKGVALFNMGKHRQALAANLKVLYLDKTMSKKEIYNLNLRIASSYKNLGRNTEAQAIYRKMLKKFKTDVSQQEIKELIKNLR